MIKYFLTVLIIINLISCKENITDVANGKNCNPLDEVEISEGNVWLPTTVLPDTGDTIHYVKTMDIMVNESNYIFVATDFAGIFLSKDVGGTWAIQNNGIAPSGSINGKETYFTSALGSLSKYAFV